MKIGLGLGLSAPALRRGGGFSPASLSPVCLIDPADPATRWQDAAGTIPAAANGDPVGRLGSLSQATVTSRPVYQTGGGLHWLDFDGVDDWMGQATLPAPSHSVVLASRVSGADNGNCSLLSVTGASTSYRLRAKQENSFQYELLDSGLGLSALFGADYLGGLHVFSLTFDAGSGTVTGFVDGQQVWQGSGYNGVLAGPGEILFGVNESIARHVAGQVYAGCIWNGSAPADRAAAEAWAASRAGIPL